MDIQRLSGISGGPAGTEITVQPTVRRAIVQQEQQEKTSYPITEQSTEDVKKAVESINKTLQPTDHSLQYSIDQQTNCVVVRLVDDQTGEVLRQIPSEDVLRLKAYFKALTGLICNTSV